LAAGILEESIYHWHTISSQRDIKLKLFDTITLKALLALAMAAVAVVIAVPDRRGPGFFDPVISAIPVLQSVIETIGAPLSMWPI